MSASTVSRRGFLRGRFRAASHDTRPPWAVAPDRFDELCDRCGDCLRACPAGILTAGDGGFPKVDFARGSGACTFCGDCVSACAPRALHRSGSELPWTLKIAVTEACLARRGVECRVCGESCEAGAIRFRPRPGGVALPETDSDRCTGCGACFAPCPTRAIAMEMHQ